MFTEDHIFNARLGRIAIVTAIIGFVMIMIGEQVMWMIGFAA